MGRPASLSGSRAGGSTRTVVVCRNESKRPTARRASPSPTRRASSAGRIPAAARRAGSATISTSRGSPPTTSTRPTPGTRENTGLTSCSAASRRIVAFPPTRLYERIGKSAGVTFWVSVSTPGGRFPRASAAAASTSCSARHMSVPSANCSESSAAPRMMRARSRRSPRTVASDSSSGRTTAACICSGGRSAARATTTIRGNSISG